MSTTIDERIVGLNALHDSKQAEVDKLLARLNTGSDTAAEDLANIKKLQDEQVVIETQVEEFKGIANRNSAAAAFKSKAAGSANAINAEMKHSGARILGVTEGGETVLDTDSKGKTIAYSSGEHLLSEKQMKAISDDSYFKAFDAYVRRAGDLDRLDSMDRKTLAEGTDTAGGYLVPVQMLRELIMKKPAPTRVSGRVRRIPVSSKEVVLPRVVYSTDNIYSTGVRVTLTGEQPAAATTARVTDPVFGQTRITIGTWMMSMPLTNDLLDDAYFPLLGWATEHFGDTDRLLEDNQILNGTGIGTRPHGIFKNPGGTDEPAVTLSSTANNIDATQIRQLPYDVPEQYINENTAWVFNRGSVGKTLAGLAGVSGEFIFRMGDYDNGLGQRHPDSLAGDPIVYSAFCADIADGAFVGVYGDLRGYYLANHTGFSVRVLTEIYAETNQVVMLGRKRFGGVVAEPFRMRVLKSDNA